MARVGTIVCLACIAHAVAFAPAPPARPRARPPARAAADAPAPETPAGAPDAAPDAPVVFDAQAPLTYGRPTPYELVVREEARSLGLF